MLSVLIEDRFCNSVVGRETHVQSSSIRNHKSRFYYKATSGLFSRSVIKTVGAIDPYLMQFTIHRCSTQFGILIAKSSIT